MARFLKQPTRVSKKESKSSKFVDWALGETAKERAGRAIGAATLVAPGGATVGLARKQIAKAIAKRKAAEEAKRKAAEEAKRRAAILAKKRRQASVTRAAQRRLKTFQKAANDPKYAEPKKPEVASRRHHSYMTKAKAAGRDAKRLLEKAQETARKSETGLDEEWELFEKGIITKREWEDASVSYTHLTLPTILLV